MIFSREECWFLYGIRIGAWYIGFLRHHSIGEWASVEFDWEKALESRFLLGWFHSHPDGITTPSSTDHKTMRSWVRTVERPLICGIYCEGISRAYMFLRKSMDKKFSYLYGKKAPIIYGAMLPLPGTGLVWKSFFIGTPCGEYEPS